MRTRTPILLSLTLILGMAAASPRAMAADTAAGPVCLQFIRIHHTTIPDDQTILFHMRDGTTWKNTLPEPCVGLRVENGFAYEPTSLDNVCSNLSTIRVLRQGSFCQLGTFTPYVPPKKAE
jgi:hypothetical protein